MPLTQRPVRPADPTSTEGNLMEWADNVADKARDSGQSVSVLLTRIGGIKKVPAATTETIGENFESIVMGMQTVEGTLIVLGSNTIL